MLIKELKTTDKKIEKLTGKNPPKVQIERERTTAEILADFVRMVKDIEAKKPPKPEGMREHVLNLLEEVPGLTPGEILDTLLLTGQYTPKDEPSKGALYVLLDKLKKAELVYSKKHRYYVSAKYIEGKRST